MIPAGNFKVLGLSPDASWDEVKSAFRRMARIYHPDVAGPEGARKFAEITEAYMTLKASIARDAASPAAHTRRPRTDVRTATDTTKRESIFKSFWRKLFRRKEEPRADDAASEEDLPPVRIRFIGSVISRAESDMYNLLSRRSEVQSRNRTEAIVRRLRSRHPGVVLLALRRISPNEATGELGTAIVDHFKKNIPTSEILEALLAMLGKGPRALDCAKMLAAHANDFSQNDALMVLKWFKRQKLSRECYAPFLSHTADCVIAGALNGWPQDQPPPETADLIVLLKKNDETILVPLLRLLKKCKNSPWVISHAAKIMKDHKSPAVRVWASAIVRDQNLS